MSEYISWSPIRRLMKHNGAILKEIPFFEANIVARDAVDELVDWMGMAAEKITKTALSLTKHAKNCVGSLYS
jgi:histone H3/H4